MIKCKIIKIKKSINYNKKNHKIIKIKRFNNCIIKNHFLIQKFTKNKKI